MNNYFEQNLRNIIFALEDGAITNTKTPEINLNKYPLYLYKFRDCSKEENFQIVDEEYLWAAFPGEFDDPFDSLVNHKLKSELPEIKSWLFHHWAEILYYHIPPRGMQDQKNNQTLQMYIDAQKQFCDSTGRYNERKATHVVATDIQNLDSTSQKEIHKLFEQIDSTETERKLEPFVEELLSNVANILRKKVRVCSLTARKDNRKVWEEHAGKYAGFAIEYDMSLVANHSELAYVLPWIFPVAYYKRFPRVALLPFIEKEFYKKLYDKDIDINDARKKLYEQLLIKKDEYRGEEEWRILSSVSKIQFPFISAVYMGYKIEGIHEKRLIDICTRKKIPLYKQKFNVINGTMSFEPIGDG